jgi:phosphoglycolate phosphatase-like HAD superfamily hydrolase
LYETEGRSNLFNKFLEPFDPDLHFLPLCLHVLRTFTPERKYNIFPEIKIVLKELVRKNKHIAVLTNGNIEQQKNKIENIKWEKLDRSLCFVFADEFEPKPSPAGVEYILKNSGIGKNSTIMIGDSKDDRDCAVNSGIEFLDIKTLYGLTAI